MQKGYSTGKLIFGRDRILPIKYAMVWEIICNWNQTQIDKDNIQENRHRVDHNYKVEDNVIITKHTE